MANLVDRPAAPASAHLAGHLGWVKGLLQGMRAGRPQVLISVVQVKGSAPRDEGARMWVDAHKAWNTIGGGHLELQAIELARQMLAQAGPRAQVRHYALGPSLGQCCGGAVWLAFEYFQPGDLGWCEDVQAHIAQGRKAMRKVNLSSGSSRLDFLGEAPTDAPLGSSWDEASGMLTDVVGGHTLQVVVCGAGHVGKAIVQLLGTLPVSVFWLDPRDDAWPDSIPDNVTLVQGDAADVVDCPDDAYWLVLTHSHALDLEIIQNVFRHKPFCFLGLIGSKTKNARFRSQLSRRFPQELVDRMVCPIGLVQTSSKLPAVIAVSVVAQLAPLIHPGLGERS